MKWFNILLYYCIHTGSMSLRDEVRVPGFSETLCHETLTPLESQEHGVGTRESGRSLGGGGRGRRRNVGVGGGDS